MNQFKKAIIDMLKGSVDVSEDQIEVPPDSKLGDYALPCFEFARVLKKSPREVSAELAKTPYLSLFAS